MTEKRNITKGPDNPSDFRLHVDMKADPELDNNEVKEFVQVFADHIQDGPDLLSIHLPTTKHTIEDGPLRATFTIPAPVIIATTFAPGSDEYRELFFAIGGQKRTLYLSDMTPQEWTDLSEKLTARNAAMGLPLPKPAEDIIPIPGKGKAETFNVAGGYFRPIFGLSERKTDLPLLLEFHEPQTPLNWAVGLTLFSLTDEDRIKTGNWQEATIQEIEDRVFCLTERDAMRHGQHREDILAEVVKLATRQNWYYAFETVQAGRAWKPRAVIGIRTPIPELELIFVNRKTGKRAFPSDPAIRQLLIPLEVKGRRAFRPDGKTIMALPKDTWELESIRWHWVQSFNDDLLLMPALEEKGKRKGLPKKTTTGKPIRKGYLIKVADNILHALGRLRAEGSGSKYACRLLIMLASNLNKTEDGIAAERVFRMLGIPDDYKTKGHRNPETLVAEAVLRLKSRDIQALLAGSDEYPRTDPNPDRRKGPYYCFKRSPEYTPRSGIVSKEDALAIEAEYEITDKTPSPDISPKEKVAAQLVLPGIVQEAPSIPSGAEIRAAREAAGMNLRDFAEDIKSGSHNTWAKYERGEPIRIKSIAPEAWDRVRTFIAQHGKNVHRK